MPDAHPFRIAHLSDLHLTATDGARRSEPKLYGALKGMNAHFRRLINSKPVQQADLVLVTGDVTDRGDLRAWQHFWDAVKGAGLQERVRVVPGNHDVCHLGARVLGDKNGFREADMQRLHQGLVMGEQSTKFPWAHSPDPHLVVFGLNSNNLGNFTAATNGMGEIGYYQLKSFASLLHRHRDVPVKIVAMHHSPNIPERETARKRGQREFGLIERLSHQLPQAQRQALNLLCIAHKVRLLVHGHLHMHEDRRITGVRYVGAASSTEPQHGPDGSFLQFPTYSIAAGSHRVSLRNVQVPLK